MGSWLDNWRKRRDTQGQLEFLKRTRCVWCHRFGKHGQYCKAPEWYLKRWEKTNGSIA